MQDAARAVVTTQGLEALLSTLRQQGYDLIGPTVRDGAIVYAPIASIADLPAGVTDTQEPGTYRLGARSDGALFGYAVGPHSWKRELLVPTARLLRVRRSKDDLVFEDEPRVPRRRAFLGARACELAAIAIQDRVLTEGTFIDADYATRRQDVFIVAVQCTEPGGTCFCASMGTGPRAASGFDLALTELVGDGEHRFAVEVGTEAGAALLAQVGHAPLPEEDGARADEAVARAGERMGRSLDTRGIKELLFANLEHPRWSDVAQRCLGCANCTMVCPTCFCTTIEDLPDLAGESVERVRRWDSCFTVPFSHVHGGTVRGSLEARYRQWLTHKLAGWIDQFGTSGCVGCGRCITWCPVGIDLTEEAAAIRSTDAHARPDHD